MTKTDNLHWTYTWNVPAGSDGAQAVSITAQDRSGNPNSAATGKTSYTIDNISPAVALSDDHLDAIVRNPDTVVVTATFTEADQVDEAVPPTITIGTVVTDAAMTKTDNLHWTYTWNVPAGNDGAQAVSISANDRAGNANSAATGKISYTIDNISPAVALSDDHPDAIVRDADTVVVTATFTEADQIDEATPPTITIGTVVTDAAMTKTDNLHWTYTWNVPSGNDGAQAVSITAKDRAGNPNSAATGKTSYTIDNGKPGAPVISATAITANLGGTGNRADHVNAALWTSFNNFKVSIANTGADNEAGTLYIKLSDSAGTPHTYTTSGEAIAQGAGAAARGTFIAGAIDLFVDGDLGIEAWIIDGAGNESDHATVSKTYGLDVISPAVELTDDHPDTFVRDADTVAITATFTEADQIDETSVPTITIGAAVTNAPMTKSSNLVWTYSWDVPAGNGDVNVSIAATDRAGNSNSAATGNTTYTIDNTPPTVTKLGNGLTVYLIPAAETRDLVFNEAISAAGKTAVEAAITAKASNLPGYSWDGTNSVLTITGGAGGSSFADDVTANISDRAGNISNNLLLIDASSDVTGPTVTLNQKAGQADPTNGNTAEFTVVFNEPVSDFTNADVDLTGTTAGGTKTVTVTGTGTTYNVKVELSGAPTDGVIKAKVNANVAHDAASNGNSASTSTDNSVTRDTAPPVITVNAVTTTDTTPALGGTIDDTSAPIEVTVGGTTYAATNNANGTWILADNVISPALVDGTYNVVASATDVAGNNGSDSTTDELTVNTSLLTVTINQAADQSDPTGGNIASFTVVFSESVTGFTNADIDLTGTTAGGTKTVTVTGSGATYYVKIELSGAMSDGVIKAAVSANGAESSATPGKFNSPSSSIDNTVTRDTFAPAIVTFAEVSTPRNTHTGAVSVTFTESVNGVDISRFTMTRNGTSVDLSGLSVMKVSGSEYSVDLSSVTGDDGSYLLELSPAGIQDLATNSLAAGDSSAWLMDGTAPTVAFSEVTSPRNTNVGTVYVTFSETVTGVDISDFELTLDGVDVPIAAWRLTGSGANYQLALSSLTGTDGTYVLSLTAAGSGIKDSISNALVTDATRTWIRDSNIPTAAFAAVTTPRNTNAGTVNVNFSENVTNVDINDFTLTRNGVPVDISGVSVTPPAGPASVYGLDLTAVTGTVGTYVLSLIPEGSGIIDGDSLGLAAGATSTWFMETTPPTGSIAEVSTPRTTAVDSVTVSFSEPVTGVDINDFTLTRNGGLPLARDGWALSGSGASYSLSLGATAEADGAYVLTLTAAGSGIIDAASNALAGDAGRNWTMDATPPTVAFLTVASPRNTVVGTVNVTFSENVTGADIADCSLTRDGTPVSLAALSLNGSGKDYTLDLTTVTGSDGVYALKLTAAGSGITDIATNTLAIDATRNWTMDTTLPTAVFGAVESPRRTDVTTVSLTFSETVTGVSAGDFTLTRNGVNVNVSNLAISGSGKDYTLDLTLVETGIDGNYVLKLNAATSGIVDGASNALGADVTVTWTRDDSF